MSVSTKTAQDVPAEVTVKAEEQPKIDLLQEIPFEYRAWDYEKEVMFDVHAIDFMAGIAEGETKNGDEIIANFKNCRVMRYTGIPDKSNIKIFEKDIVLSSNGSKCIVEFKEAEVKVGYEKETILGFVFCIIPDLENKKKEDKDIEQKFEYETFGTCINGAYEKLGNVFENPELLKSKKDEEEEG